MERPFGCRRSELTLIQNRGNDVVFVVVLEGLVQSRVSKVST